MGKNTCGLRCYFILTVAPKEVGATKKYPCKYCSKYVADKSREMQTHLKQCKKIKSEDKPIIKAKLEALDAQKHKTAIASNISPYAFHTPTKPPNIRPNSHYTVVTPSHALANNMQFMSFNNDNDNDTPNDSQISGIDTTNKSKQLTGNNDGYGKSPNLKRRRSNDCRVITNYFQRNMNAQNYKLALTFLLRWYLSQIYNGEHISIDQFLDKLFAFLCSSFADKLQKDNLIARIEEFKINLKKVLCRKLEKSVGFVGCNWIRSKEQIELWIITQEDEYFIRMLDCEQFLLNDDESKDEEEDNDLGIALFDIQSLTGLLLKLDDLQFDVIGIKLNNQFYSGEKLLIKVQTIAKDTNVPLIANMNVKIENMINEICITPPLDTQIQKVKTLIDFIADTDTLKLDCEKKSKSPTSLIQAIAFLNKTSTVIQTYCIRNVIENHIKQIALLDDSFWRDMKDFDKLFSKICEFENVFAVSSHIVFAEAINKWSILKDYYKNESFNVYKQDRFIRHNLKKRIIKSIKGIFKQMSNDDDISNNVLSHGTAIYYLAKFLDKKYTTVAPYYQSSEANKLLKAVVPLEKQSKFESLMGDFKIKRNAFEEFVNFDDYYGTKIQEFAQFANKIIKSSSCALDIHLGEQKHNYKVIDIFCYYNTKCDGLFKDDKPLLFK